MSEKPIWHASGGRKTNGTFNKFIPMLMSTPNVGNSSTWRPSWLKNLEQDIAIDRKLDVYVMARGGEIQLGRSPGKKSPKERDKSTPKSKSPKPKWTPKWLWNNHGVQKHSFQREVHSEQDVKEAYESWKSKIEQQAENENVRHACAQGHRDSAHQMVRSGRELSHSKLRMGREFCECVPILRRG